MRYRKFGRTGWQVSEIGYGMWGMGAWSGSDDEESLRALERAVDLGCNFFDTAWAYGQGHSERLLGRLLRARPGSGLRIATKIPPKSMKWPAAAGSRLEESYPPVHIRAFTEKSLENIGVGTLDLLQFHTWNDAWADDERWQNAVNALKAEHAKRAEEMGSIISDAILELHDILSPEQRRILAEHVKERREQFRSWHDKR